MKTYSLKFSVLLLPVAAAFVAGCNKEEESPFTGSDNYIAAFALVKDGVTLKGAVSPDAIVVTAPERLSLSGATATVTLSENATMAPDPATIADWDIAHTFTVTAHNGTRHRYDYSVERRLISRSGDVVLLTQADVDAFVEEVKDLDQIDGSITIGAATGQDTIYSLAGVEHLKVVTGGIVVNATYAGEDLTAFERLEKTNDLLIASKKVKTVRFPKLAVAHADLNFNQAAAIQTLDFPELTAIDKGLRIYYVDSLANIHFPKLQAIVESVTIQGRSSGVQNLHAVEFPALQKVGGSFTLSYWREITSVNLPQLTEVSSTFTITSLSKATHFAAPRLETVGALTMSNCAAMTSVDFGALKTVNGHVNPNLAALAEVHFPALETVAGSMTFSTSATITALRFPALTSAGSLTIPNAANLATLQFPALKTVEGQLSILSTRLTSLDGFPALERVGGRLYLYNLPNLTTVRLPSLQSAGTYYAYGLTGVSEIDVRGVEIGSLELYGTTMTGLTLKGPDVFSGRLYFGSPPSGTTVFPVTIEGFKTVGSLVTSLSYVTAIHFEWLERVTGLLNFSSGAAVTSINLPNLRSAGGFTLASHAALTTLHLPQLEEITGYSSGTVTAGSFTYAVTSNNLTTLELPKLRRVEGSLSITGLVAARKLEIIRFPALESLTGTLTITGTSNATFKDLAGFRALTAAAGVTISNFTQLKNFEPLKNLVPALSADTWNVAGCGYNPSYDDMREGRYTHE
ncbi:MAG: hypothetical protein LBF90_05865 [Prevotellaceae bacterium]|nr:hypothetical protein [Prevotellaceae bacterium]